MDILGYDNFNNNSINRQRKYNSNNGIYGKFSDEVDISNVYQSTYEFQVKSEDKESEKFCSYYYQNQNTSYQKGKSYSIKLKKEDYINISVLLVTTIAVSIINIFYTKNNEENVKREEYLDNVPTLLKTLLSLCLDENKERISFNSPVTSSLLFIIQTAINCSIVALTYYSIKTFGNSKYSAFIGSAMIALNNAFISNSISGLSNSPFLLLLVITTTFWAKLSYTPEQFKYSFFSSISTGLSICLNWNGIFTYVTGILVSFKISNDIKNNKKISNGECIKKSLLSIITAVFIPIVILFSVIPLTTKTAISNNNENNDTENTTDVELFFNSDTIIRNNDYDGYLDYREIIDVYNNNTEVFNNIKYNKENLWNIVRSDTKFNSEKLKHFSVVRIKNLESKKFIRVNVSKEDKLSNSSNNEYQISTGGYIKILDSKDYWRIELVGLIKPSSIKVGKTKFRLHNLRGDCYLASEPHTIFTYNGVSAPRISCSKNQVEGTVWVFDYSNGFEKNNEKRPYEKFSKKIIYRYLSKWQLSTGEHGFNKQSIRPIFWPTLNKYIIFSKTDIPGFKVNSFSWYISAIGILAFPYLFFRKIIYDRNTASFDVDTIEKYSSKNIYNTGSIVFSIGWIIHYLPYLIFRNKCLIQNYIPSIYYSLLLTIACLEIYLSKFHQIQQR